MTKTLVVIGLYLFALGVLYWFLTYEDAGTLLLLGTAVMVGIVGIYLVRYGAFETGTTPPEDDLEAHPQGAAGTSIGSFPFSSAWPVVLAVGAVVLGLGVIYTEILVPIGIILGAVAVIGLMRESRA